MAVGSKPRIDCGIEGGVGGGVGQALHCTLFTMIARKTIRAHGADAHAVLGRGGEAPATADFGSNTLHALSGITLQR